MPNFETIKEEIESLNKDIERAKFEIEFAKSTEKKAELKIKPIYLVFLLIAVFFVELSSAIIKRKYEPTIWLYCVTGGFLLVYAIYVFVTYSKRRTARKEESSLYETKRTAYEILLRKRKEIFEKFVSDTNGVTMQSAENNFFNYIWVENEKLIIVSLENEMKILEIPLDEVKYISSDDRLFDYNKFLGNATNVGNETPNSYIFTKDKCYVFHVMNYDRLVCLMPEKELLNVLSSK